MNSPRNVLKRSHASMDVRQDLQREADAMAALEHCSEHSDLELEHDSPDLSAYLDAFEVDDHDRIKLCRAYASFLSAQLAVAKKRAKHASTDD